jgi:hypothetical protein
MMVDAGATPGLWDQLALHPRAQEVASAHMYSLHARETDDFPPLFCFGDLVELELECAPREHTARTELKRVPAIVIGVIRDNWLRLLVFNRWLGNQAHSVFHVRSWNVHGNPAWLSVPRTEMRSVIFGAPVLRLSLIAAALFDDFDDQENWHMHVKPDFDLRVRLEGRWDRRFVDQISAFRLPMLQDFEGCNN